MDPPHILRQYLRAPSHYRTIITSSPRTQCSSQSRRTLSLLKPIPHPRHLTVPRILTPSFWGSMIPRPLRERSSFSPQRGWNPATPYIVLGLLVGSQAIQMLWLKQERYHENRKAEAKIGILKEVIERVQRGEEVDVESVLGTGKEEEEAEWAEVIKQLRDEEVLFRPGKPTKRSAKQAAFIEEKIQRQVDEKQTVEEKQEEEVHSEEAKVEVETIGGAKFY